MAVRSGEPPRTVPRDNGGFPAGPFATLYPLYEVAQPSLPGAGNGSPPPAPEDPLTFSEEPNGDKNGNGVPWVLIGGAAALAVGAYLLMRRR